MSSILPHPFRTCFLTGKCALNCPFCPLSPEQNEEASSFNLPADSPVINLIGGDPLLVPELPDIVKQLKSSGRIVNIFTPLYRLPKDITFLHGTNIFAYTFGFDDLEHDQMTGRNKSFQRLLANLEMLTGNSIYPILYAFITPDSIGSLPDLSTYCLEQDLGLWLELPQGFYPDTCYSKKEIGSLRYFARSGMRGWNVSSYNSAKTCCAFAPTLTTNRDKFHFGIFLAKRQLLSAIRGFKLSDLFRKQ